MCYDFYKEGFSHSKIRVSYVVVDIYEDSFRIVFNLSSVDDLLYAMLFVPDAKAESKIFLIVYNLDFSAHVNKLTIFKGKRKKDFFLLISCVASLLL